MPFTDRHLRIDDRHVAYVDEGAGGPAPLIVLHGAGFDHAELTWRFVVRDLSATRRVVAPDLPGYGGSAGFGGPHDIARLGRWLIAFMDALDIERADLAGVSMGGGIALWMALEHPARVRRLVPVSTYGIMDRLRLHGFVDATLGRGLMGLIYRGAAHPVLARIGLGSSYGSRNRVTDGAVDELRAVACDQLERRTFDDFLAAEMTPTGLRTDFTPRLAEIDAPTLIVHGLSDRVVPVRHARHAATLIPDARLMLMETGHWPMREQPALFNPALERFLDTREGAG